MLCTTMWRKPWQLWTALSKITEVTLAEHPIHLTYCGLPQGWYPRLPAIVRSADCFQYQAALLQMSLAFHSVKQMQYSIPTQVRLGGVSWELLPWTAVGRPADSQISGLSLHPPRNMPGKVNTLVAYIWLEFSKAKSTSFSWKLRHIIIFFYWKKLHFMYMYTCIFIHMACLCMHAYVCVYIYICNTYIGFNDYLSFACAFCFTSVEVPLNCTENNVMKLLQSVHFAL